MNRIYTFALLSSLVKSLHSIVIGFVVLATITTAYMSYQSVQINKEIVSLGKENKRLLVEIEQKVTKQNESLAELSKTLKESTPSPSLKASPKE